MSRRLVTGTAKNSFWGASRFFSSLTAVTVFALVGGRGVFSSAPAAAAEEEAAAADDDARERLEKFAEEQTKLKRKRLEEQQKAAEKASKKAEKERKRREKELSKAREKARKEAERRAREREKAREQAEKERRKREKRLAKELKWERRQAEKEAKEREKRRRKRQKELTEELEKAGRNHGRRWGTRSVYAYGARRGLSRRGYAAEGGWLEVGGMIRASGLSSRTGGWGGSESAYGGTSIGVRATVIRLDGPDD